MSRVIPILVFELNLWPTYCSIVEFLDPRYEVNRNVEKTRKEQGIRSIGWHTVFTCEKGQAVLYYPNQRCGCGRGNNGMYLHL